MVVKLWERMTLLNINTASMDKKTKIILIIVILLALVFAFSIKMMGSETIRIDNGAEESGTAEDVQPEEQAAAEPEGIRSRLNGSVCANPEQRPIAVMLGGDAEARPLSGLIEADVVIEMPVVTSSITRYMAIFGCNKTAEIGSVRSARHDFIPLALGFDAILAHWGGSHFALDKLNSGIMDNINALYLDGSTFYRKKNKLAPFNGFTSFALMEKYATQRGYRLTNNFSGYKFLEEEDPAVTKGRLTIGYPSSFRVEYQYDPVKNEYLRFKGGMRELDGNTNTQVAAKDVVIMYAASRQIEGQYNDVDIEGEGNAIIYRNGTETKGRWSKDKGVMASKLLFFDENGQEIAFVPGQIWIQVVQPGQSVDWTAGL